MRIPCLDNKNWGQKFGREGFGGKTWRKFVKNTFVKNTISHNVENFEGSSLIFIHFPFSSLLNKQDAHCYPNIVSMSIENKKGIHQQIYQSINMGTTREQDLGTVAQATWCSEIESLWTNKHQSNFWWFPIYYSCVGLKFQWRRSIVID